MKVSSITDTDLHRILTRTRVIALVGASVNPHRPSYQVGQFLVQRGYKVVPVNPAHVGQALFGQTIVGTVADVPDADMVDIFRRTDAVPAIVAGALEALPRLQTIWMQLGVTHVQAAQTARARGIDVVQDRCPKIEIARLFG